MCCINIGKLHQIGDRLQQSELHQPLSVTNKNCQHIEQIAQKPCQTKDKEVVAFQGFPSLVALGITQSSHRNKIAV